jgi:uncharacterized protein YdeI (YjbR/CyaY-like superfamily)
VAEPGLKAFRERDPKTAGPVSLRAARTAARSEVREALQGQRRAWTFFEALPPGYKRLMIRRIMSAKKRRTREKRLAS